MNHPYPFRSQTEPLAHQVAEVPARRDEQVHLGPAFGQRLPARRAMAFGQGIQKRIFPLQRAGDRNAQLGLEPVDYADEQGVGQTDHIRLRLGLEPLDELFQFARLIARFAAQHGQRQLADVDLAQPTASEQIAS